MKKHILILSTLCISLSAAAQLTWETARKSTISKYHMGNSTYFEPFDGKPGYGAGVVLTGDLGAAAFGDGDEGVMLVKLNHLGKEEWKRKVSRSGDEMETQAVVEDRTGHLYVFMLVYKNAEYRGGVERVVCFDKLGTQLWDKMLGKYQVMQNPTVSWIRQARDGQIALRGHVVTDTPVEGKDPVYRFWEATLGTTGLVSQKAGDVIDWSKSEWQEKFKPEH